MSEKIFGEEFSGIKEASPMEEIEVYDEDYETLMELGEEHIWSILNDVIGYAYYNSP